MNIFDEFYETFKINKIKYREPGRTVDDNGEICEWYISEDYPSIEPVFFDLLNIYEVQYHGKDFGVTCKLESYELRKTLVERLLKMYKAFQEDKELLDEFIEDVKYCFDEYYGGVVIED